MSYRLSAHAREELLRRSIPESSLEAVLADPEQRIAGHGEIVCCQSRVEISGKPYLLRAMVNEATDPAIVVTVYRTSKITKYWSTV